MNVNEVGISGIVEWDVVIHMSIVMRFYNLETVLIRK